MSLESLTIIMLIAGVANMAPVLVKKIQVLNLPIDNGVLWRGKPLLGSSKTWRGLIGGVTSAVLVAYVLRLLSDVGFDIPLEPLRGDYLDMMLYGGGIGFAALTGDLIKSLVKRQVGLAPGKSWIPFDQIDWISGVLIFLLITGRFTTNYLYLLVIGFGLHVFVKWIGWMLKIETKPI